MMKQILVSKVECRVAVSSDHRPVKMVMTIGYVKKEKPNVSCLGKWPADNTKYLENLGKELMKHARHESSSQKAEFIERAVITASTASHEKKPAPEHKLQTEDDTALKILREERKSFLTENQCNWQCKKLDLAEIYRKRLEQSGYSGEFEMAEDGYWDYVLTKSEWPIKGATKEEKRKDT